jgi:hypothetical protein
MYFYFPDLAGHGNAYPFVGKSSLFDGHASLKRLRIDVLLIRLLSVQVACRDTKCYDQVRRTVEGIKDNWIFNVTN